MGRFEILDLLRGVAAFAVLVFHSDIYLGGKWLPNGYLAVDLFFLLSGFVIAHTYDPRIASGMTLKEFSVHRLIRLYPTYLLALAVGVVLESARMIHEAGYVDVWRLASAGLLNVVFLPTFIHPYGGKDIYPFNSVIWSLFYELIANAVYHLLHRYLVAARLALLVILSGGFLFLLSLTLGHLIVGMRGDDLLLGFPRVVFSFFMGVLLRRHVHERLRLRTSAVGVAGCVLVLLAVFASGRFVPKEQNGFVDALAVLVVFPAVLLVGAGATPGARTRKVARWSGDASYPLYLFQMPFVALFAAIPQLVLGVRAARLVPWIGFALIVFTVGWSLWIDRVYDVPVRQALKAAWNRRKRAIQAKPTVGVGTSAV